MAEYYSKEQLLESGRTTWCDMYDLEDFLTEVPTADVVPKSEVAREIFGEIENIAYTHFDVRGDEQSLEILIDEFYEFKKKYTEGKT